MTIIYNKKELGGFRKQLRGNMTYEEATMWNMLRRYFKKQKFRRQYSLGNYILDFYSPKYRVAIEIDGAQHVENREYDVVRDTLIASYTITILRFWNRDINKNLDGVHAAITKALKGL